MKTISKHQSGYIFTGTAAIVFLIIITILGLLSGDWELVIGTWLLSGFLTLLNIIMTSIKEKTSIKRSHIFEQLDNEVKITECTNCGWYADTDKGITICKCANCGRTDKLIVYTRNKKSEVNKQEAVMDPKEQIVPIKENSYLSELRELSILRDKSIISKEDYNRKKEQILFGTAIKKKENRY